MLNNTLNFHLKTSFCLVESENVFFVNLGWSLSNQDDFQLIQGFSSLCFFYLKSWFILYGLQLHPLLCPSCPAGQPQQLCGLMSAERTCCYLVRLPQDFCSRYPIQVFVLKGSSLTLGCALPILEAILINMVEAHLKLFLCRIFPRIQYFVLDKVNGFWASMMDSWWFVVLFFAFLLDRKSVV